MILKKRSEVEVLSKKEVPYGGWCPAGIISSNGRDYGAQYDCFPCTRNEVTVQRVPRKAIRPGPPLVNSVDNLEAGDVVEVFNDFSWKVATVVKALGGKYYLVRLLESSRELQVHKVNTRVHRSWEDDQWTAIGKGSGCEVVTSNKVSSISNFQKTGRSSPEANVKLEVCAADNSLVVQNNSCFRVSHAGSAGTLKRAPPLFLSNEQACSGNAPKMKAVEKEGVRVRVISVYPSSLKKVDAVADPEKTQGETCMYSSTNKPRNRQSKMEWGTAQCRIRCSRERSSEANASDMDACSVGSCSVVINGQSKFSSCFLASAGQADSFSSDAESSYDCGDEIETHPLYLGGDVTARIHGLELHAYRSTLVALYASGPLSWEQEALLTNLRLSLHISNDEHLIELRNLVSSRTSIQIR